MRRPRHPPHVAPRSRLAAALVLAALALWSPGLWAQDAIREEVKKAPPPKLTRPPVLTRFVEAIYPPGLRARGVQGTVTLALDVDARGQVAKVVVLATPDAELARAAEVAARQFRFSPAEVDNKPAPVRVEYAYSFVIGLEFNPRLPQWMQDKRAVAEGEAPLVGRVREQGTRLPLAGVAVAVPGLGIEVRTDDRGAFAVRPVPPGKYQVEAISLEHKRELIDAEVRAGEQTRIEFYLQRLAQNPYETVVRGQRRKTVVSRVTLRQRELTTVPGTFGDPLRVIENLPGVARVPYVGGALLIRGAAPQDSGVYLDGIKIPQLYHFLGGPSVLNPEFLDRIDYYPGNVDVRYGRLIAGAVDVQTRSAQTKQFGGAVDINLLNTALMLKVPLTRRISISGAVRRSYIDALLPTILKATSRAATTVVPIYYDYQLRLDVDLPKDNQLFVLVFGSDDALGIASNEPADKISINLDTHIAFHRVLARWRWGITDTLISKLTPSAGIDWVSLDTGTTNVKLRQLNFALREDLEWRAHRRVRVRGGLDLLVERSGFDSVIPIPVDYRNPGSGLATLFSDTPQPVTINQTQLGLAAYADAAIDVTKRLQLIPGARIELLRSFDKNWLYSDPRLTVRFALDPKTTLKGGVGLFSQAPQPQQLTKEVGNPNLQLEHAAHVSLGVERRLLDALHVDAQLFFIDRYQQVVPTKEIRFEPTGIRPLRFTNQGTGYTYGLELLLKHDVTRRFYGWLAYTLSRTLLQREAGGDFVPFVFDQTHILTLLGSVRLGVGWELGARFRLVSGRPATPVLGGVLDSDLNRYRQLLGEAGGDRLPLFHQLDVRVEKTWFFKLWRMSVYLDVQNVYNAANPEATLYDYRFRQSGPLRGLPILPSLGIKGSF